MMRGLRLCLSMGALALVLSAAVLVEARVYGLDRRCARFDHEQHQEALDQDCSGCHHGMAQGAEPVACSSSGCHDDKRSRTGARALYVSIHEIGSGHSCVGCHNAMNAGPDDCGDCHRKPSGGFHRRG